LAYDIVIRPIAKEALGEVAMEERKRIRDRIDDLGTNPFPVGYGVVERSTPERLCIYEGSYQIVYQVLEDERIVDVILCND
jgi:mRNA-degrading endonuclease RelE of RelBE toxin-antitoxin system